MIEYNENYIDLIRLHNLYKNSESEIAKKNYDTCAKLVINRETDRHEKSALESMWECLKE